MNLAATVVCLDRIIGSLRAWSPGKLLLVAVLVSEAGSGVMVAAMSLLLHGRIRRDFLWTGVVTALAVSLLVVSVLLRMMRLLRETERREHLASQAKSAFLAAMSHETRTPLNVILGMGELLLESDLDPVQLAYARRQQAAGHTLLRLIEQTLDLAQDGEGEMVVEEEPVALRALFAEVTEWALPAAQSKEIALACLPEDSLPEWLVTDGARLRQILTDLLGNAVKFTSRGRITLRGGREESGMVRLTVEDTGIGMSPDFLARLFSPFHQADPSLTRCHGGAGLGLAHGRRVVERLGGRMVVESRQGEGSAFHLLLPWRPSIPPAPASPAPPVSGPDQEGKRILLVEDAEDNQLLMRAFLMGSPHRLTIAVHGEEAVRLVREEAFDVVIMDVQMPVMDGHTATRLIRQWERENGRPPMPIFALTAHDLEEDARKSLAAGCDLHLTKPIGKRHLLEVIRHSGEIRAGMNHFKSANMRKRP